MLEIVTLRARPDLRPQIFSPAMQGSWPEFMRHDPVAELYFADAALNAYLDTAFAVIDPDHPGTAIGRAFAVPFLFGELPHRMELPDSGWDGIIRWAHQDRVLGRPPNAVSALEITLLASHRGQGGSSIILDAMRNHVRELGYRHMFAPVRPTSKHLEPYVPMAEFLSRQDDRGLPADPWLRVHARAGGEILKIAPTSMVIPGTVGAWSSWTSMSFTRSGWVVVPGALAPVHVSLEYDHIVYVEPNVWIRHTV